MAKAGREPTMARNDKPLLHLCTLWHRQHLAVEVCGADDTLADRRTEQLVQTERQIAEMPARTPAGLLAKLVIYERNLFEAIEPEDPDCGERLALSLIADVRRILHEF
jgi:hypothetical protein